MGMDDVVLGQGSEPGRWSVSRGHERLGEVWRWESPAARRYYNVPWSDSPGFASRQEAVDDLVSRRDAGMSPDDDRAAWAERRRSAIEDRIGWVRTTHCVRLEDGEGWMHMEFGNYNTTSGDRVWVTMIDGHDKGVRWNAEHVTGLLRAAGLQVDDAGNVVWAGPDPARTFFTGSQRRFGLQ